MQTSFGTASSRQWAPYQHGRPDRHPATGSWSIYRWGWQFSGSEVLDEATCRSLCVRRAWDSPMVARWSASPLGMLWPEMDAVLIASSGGGGPPATPRRPAVVVAGS